MKHHYQAADHFLRGLAPESMQTLREVCEDIRRAEEALNESARPLLEKCHDGCLGICCRNIDLEAIIGTWDFIYILTRQPELRETIEKGVQKERPFFAADCVFLKNGTGPCIFPDNARPELCLTTFCADTVSVRTEIGRLKRQFYRLGWFYFRQRWRSRLRALLRRR